MCTESLRAKAFGRSSTIHAACEGESRALCGAHTERPRKPLSLPFTGDEPHACRTCTRHLEVAS